MARIRKQAGFTLLEILMVVTIMGIVLGVVGLNFDRNLDTIAHNEAKRFARVLNYTKEYSSYTGRILSLRLDKKRNTYYFLYVDPVQNSWSRLNAKTGSKLLSPHKVNERVKVKAEKRQAETSNNEHTNITEENSSKSSSNTEIALITPFSEFEPANFIVRGETKNYIVTTDEFDAIEIQIQ